MSWPAIRAVAAHEWATRGRSLLLLGLVAGLLGGLVVAGLGLTRRTASAPERLFAAVAPGDAEAQVFGSSDLVPRLADLPEVARSWPAQMAVVQVDGPAVIYLGVMAGPPRPAGMMEPVLVAGRAPDPEERYEVLVVESLADALGYGPGDRIPVDMLTAEEVGQFDVGFGAPDGPSAVLEVTGVARVPNGILSSSPILATPAFAAAHADVAAGTYLHVDLVGGASGYPAFAAAAAEVAAAADAPPGAEEFAPVSVAPLAAGTDDARESAGILVGGLTVAVVVATIAGLLALGQALARHHAGSAHDQGVEAALGLTARERTLARVLPASAAALVAGGVAVAIGLVGARIEPLGAVQRWEPEPGWRPDGLAVGGGALLLVSAVLVLAGATARRAGIGADHDDLRRSVGGLRFVPWRSGWALTGTTFALSRGGARRTVPVRSSLVGMILGVAGIVGGLAFGASLQRLEGSPVRWGWSGDVVVVDTTDEIQAELLTDPRIDAVTDVRSTSVRLDGEEVPAHSYRPVAGDMGWTIIEGRTTTADDEVVVGTRMAARAGIEVGDSVDLGGHSARVVGLGVGPDITGDGMGNGILLTPTALDEHAIRQDFREALVRAGPGTRVDDLAADLGTRYELEVGAPPAAVRDLAELGRLPEVLGGFLAVLGAIALAHALVLTRRRRGRDLAVLQALGSTPRQAAGALLAMATTTALVGVVIGAPLGWATARLVWGEAARNTGVAPDLLVPGTVVGALVGALVLAVALAAWPALAVRRARPAQLLRTE